jgi:hypothetical protein
MDAAENGGARFQRSESVEKMDQVNTKLKGELILLIGTMEQQLRKVQERRAQRIKAERLRREDKQDNIRKAKLDVGKIQKLTAEVQRLWSELENSYSLGLVT